eukprot:TRINITY_DN1390_c0_g1_i1.p1 TRINITY_DN1390_c0_g1~~TRINITY_DN1390_c0_g1_i1.p1  ORF type:complete len:337 (-),score=86.86 TRINITY_DN1390_c0_g1_i1:56-1066(-)
MENIKEIGEMDLFNGIVSNNYFIIDVRDDEKFLNYFLKNTRKHLPINMIEDISFENIMMIDKMEINNNDIEFYKSKFLLKIFSMEIIFINQGDVDEKLEKIIQLISREKIESVHIFKNIDSFSEKYPFLITHVPQELEYNNSLSFPNQILQKDNSFLYLGGIENAKSKECIDSLNIKNIVNVTSHYDNQFEETGIKYLRISIQDNTQQNIADHFEMSYNFIKESLEKKENILIHCVAGVSRSASLVLAFLMKYNNTSYKETFEYLRKRRKNIFPNVGFLKQLLLFEKKLFGVNSASIQTYFPDYDENKTYEQEKVLQSLDFGKVFDKGDRKSCLLN